MNMRLVVLGGVTAMAVVAVGMACTPLVFAGRVLPGVRVGTVSLAGVAYREVPVLLSIFDDELKSYKVTLSLHKETAQAQLSDLGVSIDVPATTERLKRMHIGNVLEAQGSVSPVLAVDAKKSQTVVFDSFPSSIKPPQDATLKIVEGQGIVVVSAESGEGVDLITFERDVLQRVRSQQWQKPVELQIIATAPDVIDTEVADAYSQAKQLLERGLVLTFAEQTWEMKPFTVKRLIRFVPKTEDGNTTLGVAFDRAELQEYLKKTLSPDIDQPAQDARFQRENNRVTQFAMPREGRTLNIDKTVDSITAGIDQKADAIALVVDVLKPAVQDVADIQAIGVTTLLARGESDFVGSPANRRHNIEVGVSRYHGLLISSGQEFSFNQYLGAVDAEHGFKPELVIKANVTTPEFGGGLCQVSTTAFRAAVKAGLEVTQRRNHAYVVRYYGKPGFDSTIYPPYTDLRFINNTPGYILIQARIEGTKVIFEFWGTDDGRQIEVAGPWTYDQKPDGSVKARLTQKVVKDGVEIINDTFYSRYKSPDLFPKVVEADDPQRAAEGSSSVPVPGAIPAESNEPNNIQTTSVPTTSPAATARPE